MKKIFIVFLLLILNFISSIAFAENLRFVGKDTEGLNHYLRTDTLKEVTVYDKDNPYDYNTRGMYYEEVTIENGAKSYMGYIFAFLQGNRNAAYKRIIYYKTYDNFIFVDKPEWKPVDYSDSKEVAIRKLFFTFVEQSNKLKRQ